MKEECLPPLVDTDIRGAGEPRIEHEHAPKCLRTPQTLPQRRVVVQSETLAEPVHHVLVLLAMQTASLGGRRTSAAPATTRPAHLPTMSTTTVFITHLRCKFVCFIGGD